MSTWQGEALEVLASQHRTMVNAQAAADSARANRDAAIAAMVGSGVGVRTIARHLGLNASTVSRIVEAAPALAATRDIGQAHPYYTVKGVHLCGT